jgi:hypothetical protein
MMARNALFRGMERDRVLRASSDARRAFGKEIFLSGFNSLDHFKIKIRHERKILGA